MTDFGAVDAAMINAFGVTVMVTPMVAGEAQAGYDTLALVQEPDVESEEGHADIVGNEMVITFLVSALSGGLEDLTEARVELADGRIFDTNRIAHDEGGLAQGLFTRRS